MSIFLYIYSGIVVLTALLGFYHLTTALWMVTHEED